MGMGVLSGEVSLRWVGGTGGSHSLVAQILFSIVLYPVLPQLSLRPQVEPISVG